MFLCKFVHYMQNVSAICSVLTLTAMSIERYYAIVHPMKAQYLCTVSQAKKVISATWVLSFVLAMPTLWIQVREVQLLINAFVSCLVSYDGRLLDVIVPKFTRSQSRDVIESSTLHSDDNQTGPNAFRLVRRTWQSGVDGHEMTSVHWTGSAKRP